MKQKPNLPQRERRTAGRPRSTAPRRSIRLAVNKVHFPVRTLGFGARVGVWLQGCSIRCRDCISRDTWVAEPRHFIEVEALVTQLQPWLAKADGVTISGGEPFDQPEGLGALLEAIRLVHRGDLLVFSGYSSRRLLARHRNLTRLIDVLISGPYRASAAHTLCLRGSDNQHVHLLTALARERYPEDIDKRPWESGRQLEVSVVGDTIWMVGIPRPEELNRLRRVLAEKGYVCHTSGDDPPDLRL
jgi:anaerobic ribonucleoside-triphosphate reductase activating protein